MKAIFTLILLTAFIVLGYQTYRQLCLTWELNCEQVDIEAPYEALALSGYPREMSQDDTARLAELDKVSEKAMEELFVFIVFTAVVLTCLCCICEPARIITVGLLSGIASIVVFIIGVGVVGKVWDKLDDD